MNTILKKKNQEINLIPQTEFDVSAIGRILKWALSTFRIMVIVTELIVMTAFMSRFWLDAKNSDLNEEISINKAQVLAYSDIESTFRLNQNRISIAKSLFSEKKIDKLIYTISGLIPADISFNSISISGNEITIKATAFSERSIAQFLVNLDAQEEINEVNLSQVSSSIENSALTIFTVTGVIK